MTTPPKPIQPLPLCRDCDEPMELGFTADIGHMVVAIQRWIPGEVRASWFSGQVASGQYHEGIPTLTYRCPKCYRLEFFAPPTPKRP